MSEAKRARRSVCINSQPQFAPSQVEARVLQGEVAPPRSILKGAPPSAAADTNVAPSATKKDAAGTGMEEDLRATPSPTADPNHLQDSEITQLTSKGRELVSYRELERHGWVAPNQRPPRAAGGRVAGRKRRAEVVSSAVYRQTRARKSTRRAREVVESERSVDSVMAV